MSRLKQLLARTLSVRSGHQSSIQAMEGMRGLAVMLVFLVHYVMLSSPWIAPGSITSRVALSAFNVGNAGVDLFFVLSGYLIYRMLITKTTPFAEYAVRRVRRIYPAFLAVLALYLVLAVWFPGQRTLPDGWRPLLVYIGQNVLLLPGIFSIQPIITVAWSLSYEVFYYLAVPCLVGLLRLRAWPPRQRMRLLAVLTLAGFVAFQWQMEHIRLLMFLSGMLLFEVLHHTSWRTRPGVGLLAFAVAVAGMIAFRAVHVGETWRVLLLFVSFFVLCLDAFGPRTGITARPLTSAPVRALGNMSYSYYLIHGLTLKAAFMVAEVIYPPRAQSALFWILLLPMFAATLVSAFCLFALVERPLSLLSSQSVHVPAGSPRPAPTSWSVGICLTDSIS
ncbi:MAG TPA: acyltransferase [Vicinamibacterales bacterium]|nr:acyltransferase [Vicinamibacterales bacterium]